MNDNKSKTVAELIEMLRGMPQDLEVYTEGCDCIGNVGSVKTNYCWLDKERYVLICRTEYKRGC